MDIKAYLEPSGVGLLCLKFKSNDSLTGVDLPDPNKGFWRAVVSILQDFIEGLMVN